nr:HAD-IA family hydrolase [Phytoactinopolyspora alkaliphila]
MLLLDLDDTVLDRSAVVRRWARRFFGAEISPPDLGRLLDMDAGAKIEHDEMARQLKERYPVASSVDDVSVALGEALRGGLEIDATVWTSLTTARERGWSTVIVTNGAVDTQERKIRASGLDRVVDAWVVSEAAGVWKPDPVIFQEAAERAGQPLTRGWMVGDNPHSDIAGACNAGIPSVWLHHGRTWPAELDFAPTGTAGHCAEAIMAIVGERPASGTG